MITITRYDNTGLIDVSVERYGYHHSYKNVSFANYSRLMRMGGMHHMQRKTTYTVTTIKL